MPVITGAAGFCPGDSTVLNAGGGYNSYQWSTGATTQTIQTNTPGNYSVIVYKDGCKGTSQIFQVAVFPSPAPTIDSSGPLMFCDGDSVRLDAGGCFSSYLWSNGDTTESIEVKSPGEYFVTVTNANGCAGRSASLNTCIKPSPDIAAGKVYDTTVCPHTSVTFTISLTNKDSYSHSFTFSDSTAALSQQGATLPPGATDTLSATFTALDTGQLHLAYHRGRRMRRRERYSRHTERSRAPSVAAYNMAGILHGNDWH